MAETVNRCHKVVFRLRLGITHQQLVEHRIVGIGKEYRLDVGIVHAYMLHAVFLLVTTGQLMLLDVALHVVVHVGTDHQSVLGLAIHRLRIYIIMFLRILNEPALVLELLEVLGCLLVNPWVILGRTYREVYFRLNDVIQTLLVVACFSTGFFTVKHVVWTALHLFHQLLWRADSFKWFYYCHDFIDLTRLGRVSLFAEIAFQQSCEASTVAGLILSHLVNGIVDGVKTSSFGVLGNAELVLTCTSLGSSTLLQVGLRIPYALTKQLSETAGVVSLLKSVALEGLGNLGIALTISLTGHGQIHTNLATLTIEVVAQVLNHFLAHTLGLTVTNLVNSSIGHVGIILQF